MPEENTYAVRVFSREHATLGGPEYRAATPPVPGDEIAVRVVNGDRYAYGATTTTATVKVIVVDSDRKPIDAHLIGRELVSE